MLLSAGTEGGYAPDAEGVAGTVRAVLAAGAAGIGIEDGAHRMGATPPRSAAGHGERLAAPCQAADAAKTCRCSSTPVSAPSRGAPVGTFPCDAAGPAAGPAAGLERAAACRAAGEDGVLVPGAAVPPAVKALAAGVSAPLDIPVGPGPSPVTAPAAPGVARVSAGSGIAGAA